MYLLRACATAVFVTLAIGVTNAQIPSELTRMGFNGPVRTVWLEIHEYSWEDSQWEGREPIHGVTRFDRHGRCLTSHVDPGSGWRPYGVPHPPARGAASQTYEIVRQVGRDMGWKTVWRFDKEGRLERFEAYAIYESGPSLSNWQQYSYDSQGRVATMTYWADWGRHPNQTEPYPPVRLKYWFDDAGRIGGWSNLDKPGSKVTLTYNEKGQVLKTVDERVDGNIIYVDTYDFDGYDQQGNWTVQTVTRLWRTDDGDDHRSKTVLRRSLTYRHSTRISGR